MKNVLAKISVPLICSALIFSGCAANKGAGTKSYSVGTGTDKGTITSSTTTTQSSSARQNIGTAGTASTNRTTTAIGSGGISSSIESQLHRSGISGTRVLVLDDTVILGQTSTGMHPSGTTFGSGTTGTTRSSVTGLTTGTESSLTGNYGTSGTGTVGNYGMTGATRTPLNSINPTHSRTLGTTYGIGEASGKTGPYSSQGTIGTSSTSGSTTGSTSTTSSLKIAQAQVQTMLSGARVLTVTHPEALRAMDRVKSALKSNTVSNAKVASEISTILQYATPYSVKGNQISTTR